MNSSIEMPLYGEKHNERDQLATEIIQNHLEGNFFTHEAARQHVYETAKKTYTGKNIPYLYNDNGKGDGKSGMSCSGLISRILSNAGVVLTYEGKQYSYLNALILSKIYAADSKVIPNTEDRTVGKLLFRKAKTGKIHHVAVITGVSTNQITLLESRRTGGVGVYNYPRTSFEKNNTDQFLLGSVVRPT